MEADDTDLVIAPARLSRLPIKGTYSNGDHPLTQFYIPALSVSCRYDRMAGYYSSSVLRAAAAGVRRFIDNAATCGGQMRLIVGAQLSPEDVEAIRVGSRSHAEAAREALTRVPLLNEADSDEQADQYVKMLGWMVREGFLEIKVGIPLDTAGHPLSPEEANGYFHSKFGVLTDTEGNRVAFIGSGNETASGWLLNHETFSVAKSWLEEVWAEQGDGIAQRFERHWNGAPDRGWWVTDLANVDERLLSLVPHDYKLPDVSFFDPSDIDTSFGDDVTPAPTRTAWTDGAASDDLAEIRDIPKNHPFTAALTAPAVPLPHQERLLHKAVTTFPRGYLFADPVGFGKTMEVGFTLRELLVSGQASTALILTPASVVRQWQEELAEKVGLIVPRYEDGGFVDVDGGPVHQPPNTQPWSAFPIVLASSHLARRRDRRREILASGRWDIVVVDEAHHARRRGSKANDTPNSLLTLLRDMRDADSWKALYLATATPMQMYPHEVWDLLELLTLPGRWGNSAQNFVSYYRNLGLEPGSRDWVLLSDMLADYFSDLSASRDHDLAVEIRGALGGVRARKILDLGSPGNFQGMPAETAAKMSAQEDALMGMWLRRHTPMRDRAFRNTRETLHQYQEVGIIPEDVNIPTRHVDDIFIDLDKNWERPLYDRIENYITRYYNAYVEGGAKALGFIMTVYRRRLTSSFYAIRRSLERRLDGLERGVELSDLLTDDDRAAAEGTLFDMDDLEIALGLLNNEIEELRSFVKELQTLSGEDTKASQLIKDLTTAFNTYDTVVIFTQYTDTMDYVRGRLIDAGHRSIGCYSGRGGEIWNATNQEWDHVTKTFLKNEFRAGRVKILVGTDSMSEGLNLQTSSCLFNYDMPWNLMRVEQRIGRIDRIGAARPTVEITNYFYADTVEEAVYRGIRGGHEDFTAIIGSAQPVLGAIETAIGRIALSPDGHKDIDQELDTIRADIEAVNAAPVHLDDINTAADTSAFATLAPAITLDELRRRLLNNPLTDCQLQLIDEATQTYRLSPETTTRARWRSADSGEGATVTFDRETADEKGIPLLTYGHPLFDALMTQVDEPLT